MIHKDEGKKYCVERISARHYDWIVLSDCAGNTECKVNYPDSPICDQDTGLCSAVPDNLKTPRTFVKEDICKKKFGDSFVFDTKAKRCGIPKCDVSLPKDSCPGPSQCWRGSCYVFPKIKKSFRTFTNKTITHCVDTDGCKHNNQELCANVSDSYNYFKSNID